MGRMRVLWLLLAFLALLTAGCAGSAREELSPVPAQAQTLTQALAELDALKLPTGADPAVFTELKAALRGMLTDRADARCASAAPDSARSAVSDLTVERLLTQSRFTWSYRNEADYNQDGMVNVPDLVPLSIYFGKNSTAADWAAASLADGNDNGMIDLGDLGSMGVNLWRTLTHYRLETSLDAGATWQPVADVPFSSSTLIKGERRRFSYTLDDPAGGDYRLAACDGAAAGAHSNSVQWTGPQRQVWPMYMHDPQHSSRSSATAAQTGALKWAFQTTGPGTTFTTAVAGPDGTIYAGGNTELFAINPDGTLKWRVNVGRTDTAPAVAPDGTIYIF